MTERIWEVTIVKQDGKWKNETMDESQIKEIRDEALLSGPLVEGVDLYLNDGKVIDAKDILVTLAKSQK